MRAVEIFEAYYAPLYHGTSVSQMISAVHQNKLDADGYYICFSRDINVAKRFCTKSESTLEIWMNDHNHNDVLSSDPTDDEMATHFPLAYAEHYFVGSWTSGGAILILDQQKIRNRFKLRPTADSRDSHKWEMEERLHRDLVPLRDYIIGIKFMKNAAFWNIANSVIRGDEALGITPHPEYQEAIDFIRGKIVV